METLNSKAIKDLKITFTFLPPVISPQITILINLCELTDEILTNAYIYKPRKRHIPGKNSKGTVDETKKKRMKNSFTESLRQQKTSTTT